MRRPPASAAAAHVNPKHRKATAPAFRTQPRTFRCAQPDLKICSDGRSIAGRAAVSAAAHRRDVTVSALMGHNSRHTREMALCACLACCRSPEAALVRDISIELEQKPGELARVASMLARQQVTLRAGIAVAVGRRLIARFIPSDIEASRRALDAAGVPFEESEILTVLLESRAGELPGSWRCWAPDSPPAESVSAPST
jgi:hypothetical protein